MRAFHCNIVLAPKIQTLSYRFAIVCYLSILILGNLPGARANIGAYASGSVLHSMAYATITLLLFVGSKGKRHERAIKAVLTVMAMGAVDEYVQSFFTYRGADVMDWTVDVVSAITSSAVLWAVWPKNVEGHYGSPR